MTANVKRGGARAGAGRPRRGTREYKIRMEPATHDALQRFSAEHSLSFGDCIKMLLCRS